MTREEFTAGAWYPALCTALSLDGNNYAMDDVWAEIDAGTMQFWPGVKSGMVTNIVEFPQGKVLHFFLAGGDLAELEAMTPTILEWAKVEHQCIKASLIGRRGWERSFLTRTGWSVMPLVHMEARL